ncbi:MAG: glucose-6-phosphate isomerase family protein [Candidatus Paceibacterota bacterium]
MNNEENIDLTNLKPDVRTLEDMRGVLFDQEWAKNQSNIDLYYMYRGINKLGELRYDITVMPPVMIGEEFNKTKGHEHPCRHSELYTVLEGEAIFLFQKGRENIEDVYAVMAKPGDCVTIGVDYSHITINPSKEKPLKMANWVSEVCEAYYDFIEKQGGACYFYTNNGWIKNKNYASVPEIRFEEPLKSCPPSLDFLK